MFTIIICTFNGSRTLERVIKKVLSQVNYDKYVEEFIVVDNSSTDNTAEIVKTFGDRVKYSFEGLAGLSNARLNGVKQTKSEWIVFIDDDNELDNNWIEIVSEFITNHPEVSFLCGSTIPKLDFEPTAHEIDNLREFHKSLAISNLSRNEIDFNSKEGPMFGAGLTIKTEILIKLANDGWLSMPGRKGNSLSSGEDGEIFYYAQKHNYINGYCPSAVIEHNIPKKRLEDSYIYELCLKLGEADFQLMSRKKLYWLRRIKMLLLSIKPISKKGKSKLRYSIEKRVKKNNIIKILKKMIFIR